MDPLENLVNQLLAIIDSHKFGFSMAFVAVLLFIKHLVIRRLHRIHEVGSHKRYLINFYKNIFNALIALGLLTIWASEIQNLALSIAAFLVAIVFATREFIQCFMGFLYAVSARPFRVGDWINVGDVNGEVVELDWAKTTLLELDDDYGFTGRTMYIPNSQIITKAVINLNFLKRYSLHTFEIVLEPTSNPYELLPNILERARFYLEEFHDVALRYKSLIESKMDAEFIDTAPVVLVETNQYAKFKLLVTLFCPVDKRIELEQKITADIMLFWFQHNHPQQIFLTQPD